MSEANVAVSDVTGNKEQEASLPTDAPVRRIIVEITPKVSMPSTGPDGHPLNY